MRGVVANLLASAAAVAWLSSLCLMAGADETVGTFAGLWSSDFGVLDLVAEGSEVTGTYSCCQGELRGEVRGKTLRFSWWDPIYGEGWGTFTLSGDGRRLSGVWGVEGDPAIRGAWNAERLPGPAEPENRQPRSDRTPRPSGQPVAEDTDGTESHFEVSGSNPLLGPFAGTAVLRERQGRVRGQIDGVYTADVVGRTMKLEVVNRLEGTATDDGYALTWSNPRDGSRGSLDMRRSGDRFRGRWRTADGQDAGELVFTPADPSAAPPPVEDRLTAMAGRDRALAAGRRHLEEGQDRLAASRFAAAAASFEAARQSLAAAGATDQLALAVYGLAVARQRTGRYEEARQLYRQVLNFGPEVDETTRLLADTGLTTVNVELGLLDRPAGADRAVAGTAPPPTGAAGPPRSLIDAKHEGQRRILAGDYDGALEVLGRSLAAHRASGREPGVSGRIDLAGIHEAAAHAATRLERFPEAMRHLDAAEEIWRQLDGARPNLATLLATRGLIRERTGDPAGAERDLRSALEIEEELAVPDRWSTQHQLARLYAAEGRATEALGLFRRCLGILEGLRSGLRTDETKVGYFTFRVEPYHDFVAFLLESGRADGPLEALEVTEMARARALVELIAAAGEAPATAGLPPDERPSFARVEPWKRRQILELARGGESTWVSYFVTAEKTYAWVLTPGGEVRWRALPVRRNDLATRVEALRPDSAWASYKSAARRLWDDLVAPLDLDLEVEGSPLTILPYDVLNSVPFAALLAPEGRFLAELRPLSVLPSFTAAEGLAAPRLAPGDRALVVARPTGTEGLEHAGDEARAIARLFGPRAKVLTGGAASRAGVLAELPRFDVLVFATHGRSPSPASRDFYLELAAGERLGREDLAGVALRAKLAVLSACETHAGERRSGDELLSLSRAFLAAGAGHVLATLWAVDDLATSRIVEGFFGHLGAGRSPAQALQLAQQDYLETASAQKRRPYFWAPWVLVGRGS